MKRDKRQGTRDKGWFFALALAVVLLLPWPAAGQTTVIGGGGEGGASAFSELTDVGCSTVSFSATPTFNAGAANCLELTLTGNVTSSTLSGETPGQTILLRLTQDATGGRTFVYPGEVVGDCSIDPTADVTTEVLLFVSSAGASVQGCRVPSGPDALTFTPAAPAAIPNPPSGDKTFFLDSTNSDKPSLKDDVGSVLEVGGAGGGGALVFSQVTSTDDPTAPTASKTHATITIPAAALSVGDYCVARAQFTFTDDGDATGTWGSYLAINGTTTNEAMNGTSYANGDATVSIEARFSVDSPIVVEYMGWGTEDQDLIGAANRAGTRTVDITNPITVNAQTTTTGGGADSGDVVTFKNMAVQCWTNTP